MVEEWNNGMVEWWKNGIMEWWKNGGRMEEWNNEMMEERISDRERFAQQNLMPVPFFRGVACVLDCGND